MKTIIQKLIDKHDLTADESYNIMLDLMSGKLTEAQIAAFLIALRCKGETINEITGCARAMREKASNINPKAEFMVDTCGTGGDCANTINISTIAAFVVAGCGTAVAKHGNKSVSSKCGSADLLEALGVNIMMKPDMVKDCIEQVGIGFMFAPIFHKAMKHAIKPRKEIGVRTIFNILGPLTNPANAPSQLIGVFDPELTEPLANVLNNLGSKHAFVVHGYPLDEVSLIGKTKISELKDGKVKTYYFQPSSFGFNLATLDELKSNDIESNKKYALEILKGIKSPKRDIVVINAAFAIVASGKTNDIGQAIRLAEESIDSGKALEKLNQLIEFSNKNGK